MVVTLTLNPEDRGSYWAAWIEGMGTYAYAENSEDLSARAQEMFGLLADSFDSREELLSYLDRRGIAYGDVAASLPAGPHDVRVQV